MRISDWSSDVCSSDLQPGHHEQVVSEPRHGVDRRAQGALAGRGITVECTAQVMHGQPHQDEGEHEAQTRTHAEDRKSVVKGKSVSVRVDHGGSGIIKKTNTQTVKRRKNKRTKQ